MSTAQNSAQDVWCEFRAMGSPCLIRVVSPALSTDALQAAMAAAIAEVQRIEQRFSRYREDSVVSRINAAAGLAEPVPVDAETAGLLGFADQLHRESGGLFDISSGVLRQVWDFKSGELPSPQALAACLARVGWSAVEFDGQAVRLPRAGMELDFGGFGKEYAADRAATLLIEAGCTGGFVNLGGDLRVIGPMLDGTPWRLGIAHPRQPGQMAAELGLHSGALATSGDYEKFMVVAGQRYCHILDPRTGWPVTHWQSVSVVAPSCLAAGALTTIAMLSQAEAPAFLQAQRAPCLLIDAQGQRQAHGLSGV